MTTCLQIFRKTKQHVYVKTRKHENMFFGLAAEMKI